MLSTFSYLIFHVVRNPGSAPWSAGMAPTVDVKYDFTPYDCTPGDPWDVFSADLLRHGTKTDDRGYSLADHLLGTDEGGPLGPAPPVAPAAANKAAIALRKRAKESYGLLSKHILDRDTIDYLAANHPQDGNAAYQYMVTQFQTTIDPN